MTLLYVYFTLTMSSFNLLHSGTFTVSYENKEACENDRFYSEIQVVKFNPQYSFKSIESFCMDYSSPGL